MTINEALKLGTQILNKGSVEAPAREAGVLLSFVLGKDKSFLYAHGSYILSAEEDGLYRKGLASRAAGKPLQYVTGVQEFMSIQFKVNEHVLIPRPDTEVLVEAVLGQAGNCKSSGLKVLDLCTGSGCIAVSLAFHLEACHVTAADISEQALAVARDNACNAGVSDRVEFIRSDLFSELSTRKFDIIVSNPPYIPEWQLMELQCEVRDYEPRLALNGGSDGLDFYRSIIEQSPQYLKNNGILALEVGAGQAPEVLKLMEPVYNRLCSVKDLAGIERAVTGILKLQ